MEFQSLAYVFGFLPLTLAGYYLLRKTRFANLFMLLASLFFYAASAIWYLVPLFITALLDFFVGQRIAASDDSAYRRRLLIISCVANLGFLSVFKYTGWLSNELAAALAIFGIMITPISFALPPGISFYTFQSMSYTIDIYRREFRPYRSAVDYMSFVAFFPHLVAGPMMRARDLLPQLARLRLVPTSAAIASGMFLILFGLFQKTVIADNLGGIVELVGRAIPTDGKSRLAPGLGLIYVYAFAFQIYCDFSAYSTIARGTARLFGVDLMRNFRTPYFSSNPSEFWQRWHISLSTWLRDYLYIPLGGSRGSRWMTMRNLVITMFLGGLWHGAGIFFIVWGLWHGFLLVLYRIFPIDGWLIARWPRVGRVIAILLFFHLVCIGWIFFRATPAQFPFIWDSILSMPSAIWRSSLAYAPDFGQALVGKLAFLSTVWGAFMSIIKTQWIALVLTWGLILLCIPVIVADFLGWRRGTEFPDLYEAMPVAVKTLVILALTYGITFLGRRGANEFIYFAF